MHNFAKMPLNNLVLLDLRLSWFPIVPKDSRSLGSSSVGSEPSYVFDTSVNLPRVVATKGFRNGLHFEVQGSDSLKLDKVVDPNA